MWPKDRFHLDFDYERVKADLESPRSLMESRQLYAAPDGLPALKESWVVFLDILGTRGSMPQLDDSTLRDWLLLLDRLRWFLVDDDWGQPHQQALSFSDNLVVGEPLRAGDELLQLGLLIEHVASYQLNLANRGVFLRGGIARGPLYMDGRVATGQGLIDAYRIEASEAGTPRVLIDASVADEIVADEAAPSPRWSWRDSLLRDIDGRLFVSYLPVIGYDETPGDIERGLVAHKSAIEAGLAENAHDDNVLRKYQWTAWYHNYVCETLYPKHDGQRIDTVKSQSGRFTSELGASSA